MQPCNKQAAKNNNKRQLNKEKKTAKRLYDDSVLTLTQKHVLDRDVHVVVEGL